MKSTNMKSTVLYLAVFALVAATSAAETMKRPVFVLPETLYAAPGLECNVYFAAALDSVRPDGYAFELLYGSANPAWGLFFRGGMKGVKYYSRCFSPEEVREKAGEQW